MTTYTTSDLIAFCDALGTSLDRINELTIAVHHLAFRKKSVPANDTTLFDLRQQLHSLGDEFHALAAETERWES